MEIVLLIKSGIHYRDLLLDLSHSMISYILHMGKMYHSWCDMQEFVAV